MGINKKGKGIIFWFFVILILGALIYFGTKYYFVASLLLGNDLAVKLNPSDENIFLTSGESKTISFGTSILANPFCSADCTSKFIDLSKNKLIDTNNFTLKTALSESKNYDISASKSGSGQDYYRFEVKCKGIESFFCPTNGDEKSKSILIIMNYGLNKNEEKTFDNYKSILSSLIIKTSALDQRIKYDNSVINKANNLVINETEDLKILETNVQSLNKTIFEAKSSLEALKLSEVGAKINDSINKLASAESEYSAINLTVYSVFNSYNNLIIALEVLKNKLEGLKQIYVTNYSALEIEALIKEYNEVIVLFVQKSVLNEKQNAIEKIFPKINSYNTTNDNPESGVKVNHSISAIPEKINLTGPSISYIKVEFKDIDRQCCLFGKCSTCCKNCTEKNYPVIFLHGHAFNRGISAEYSIEDFQAIQEKLETDGYLNAGALLISPQEEQEAIWSEINYPLTLRASYYFDIYQNPGESSVIQTKSDSLDSYALRLKDIIDSAKYKTGKNKAIVIAHSMGGLVVRRYMHIFGSDSVDRFVMIGTPNHGISDNILKLCSVTGESLECRDMDETSLFMNKLNYAETIKIPAYNFIGIGCDMAVNGETQQGDGIAINESIYFKDAINYYVQGDCEETKIRFLHNDMLNPYQYPDVYNKIKDILKS